MKRSVVAPAVLAVLFCSVSARAQRGVVPGESRVSTSAASRPASKPASRPASAIQAVLEEMRKVCDLSEEQHKRAVAAVAEADKAAAALAADFEPVKAQWERAAKEQDPEAVKAAIARWQDLYGRQMVLVNKAEADVLELLTPPQKTQWQEHKYVEPVLAQYKDLGLTAEQIGKIKTQLAKTIPDIQAAKTPAEQWAAVNKVHDYIAKDVLTPGQAAKGIESRVLEQVLATFKAVDLTEEQIGKIRSECARLSKSASQPSDQYVIWARLYRYVQTEILTEEQRKALAPRGTPGPAPQTRPAQTPAN